MMTWRTSCLKRWVPAGVATCLESCWPAPAACSLRRQRLGGGHSGTSTSAASHVRAGAIKRTLSLSCFFLPGAGGNGAVRQR